MHRAPKNSMGYVWGMLKEVRPGRILSYELLVIESLREEMNIVSNFRVIRKKCHLNTQRKYMETYQWYAFVSKKLV